MSWAGFAKGFLPHMEKLSDTIAERNKLRMEEAKETAETRRKVLAGLRAYGLDETALPSAMQVAYLHGVEGFLDLIKPNPETGQSTLQWRSNPPRETPSTLPNIRLNADSRTNPADQQTTTTPEPDTLADETAAALGAATPTANTSITTPNVDPVSVTPPVESPVTQNTVPTAQPTRVAAATLQPTERRVFETGAGAFVIRTPTYDWGKLTADNYRQKAQEERAKGNTALAEMIIEFTETNLPEARFNRLYSQWASGQGFRTLQEAQEFERMARIELPEGRDLFGTSIDLATPDGRIVKGQRRLMQDGSSQLIDIRTGQPLDNVVEVTEESRREAQRIMTTHTQNRIDFNQRRNELVSAIQSTAELKRIFDQSGDIFNLGGDLQSFASNFVRQANSVLEAVGNDAFLDGEQFASVFGIENYDGLIEEYNQSPTDFLERASDVSDARNRARFLLVEATYSTLAAAGQRGTGVAVFEFKTQSEAIFGSGRPETILANLGGRINRARVNLDRQAQIALEEPIRVFESTYKYRPFDIGYMNTEKFISESPELAEDYRIVYELGRRIPMPDNAGADQPTTAEPVVNPDTGFLTIEITDSESLASAVQRYPQLRGRTIPRGSRIEINGSQLRVIGPDGNIIPAPR